MRRPATAADRDFVRRANRLAYEAVVLRVFGRWDEERLAADFDEKWGRGGFEVIELDGEPAGAIWTSDEGDHLRLREIFLLPAWQGRGIGTRLVAEELARARRLGKSLRLRVLRESRARPLYERLGFAVREEAGEKVWMEAH